MRDLKVFREQALAALSSASREALDAPGPEEALACFTSAAFDLMGDREAHLQPGALKEGERQYFVAGFFMISSDRRHNIVVAQKGFPPEQHHMHIPIDLGHPGWMVKNQVPLILPNTDDHAEFTQILKTSRMGSAIYAPMFWQSRMLGHFDMAAQARNTMSQLDLDAMVAFANVATAAFAAHGGPAWLAALAEA